MKKEHQEIKFKSPFLQYRTNKIPFMKNEIITQKGYKNNKLYRSDMKILTECVNLLNQQKDENYGIYTNVLIANKKQCAQLKRSCNYHVNNMILPSHKMFSPFKIRYYSEKKKAFQKKFIQKKQKQEYMGLSEDKLEQIHKNNLIKQQSQHKNLRQITSKMKGRRHVNNIFKTSIYLKQQQQKKNLTYFQIYHPIYIEKQKNQLQSLKQMISKTTTPLLQEQNYLPKIKKKYFTEIQQKIRLSPWQKKQQQQVTFRNNQY